MGKRDLTREQVSALISYDPRTGEFTWVDPQSNRVKPGDLAGHESISTGYVYVGVCGHSIPAHQLAYLMMTGRWPNAQIDHRNRDRSDNRWCNLRPATVVENAANTSIHRDNSSGLKGIHRHHDGRWRAQIMRRGRKFCLGCHDTPEQAHAAYVKAAEMLHGEFATGGQGNR